MGKGTARGLLCLEESDLGQSEGKEVRGIRVTWDFVGLGKLWVLFCIMGRVLSLWITGSDWHSEK